MALVTGALLVGWASVFAVGMARLWHYEGTSGTAAAAPAAWPAEASVRPDPATPLTLVMFLHPQCPCSRASVEELARLMAHAQGAIEAKVFMIRPDGMPAGWERTSLWDSAAAIPGVSVSFDAGGAECRRFGAATSGQALLYDGTGGRLLFAGGITESRGHAGDNAGSDAILTIARGHAIAGAPAPATPVYGCPLFGPQCQQAGEGNAACRK